MSSDNDVLQFDETPPLHGAPVAARQPWRVLIVDDDPDVHDTTQLALEGVTILDRPLLLLHAFTAATAIELLRKDRAVAAILLDVVMETPTAGLDIIARIRAELGLHDTRIILRTGQPGYAPELETVRRYDINDYHNKGELTRNRLYVALLTALRAYDQLTRVATLTERLRDQAYFDALVELPNRNAFIEAIDRRIADNDHPDNVLALIDIDEFAEINDMFGHNYADRLLAAVARRIERSMDSADGGVLIARVGTDTFGVFGHADLLSPLMLQAIFAAPFAQDDSEHTVSVAVGLVRLAEIPDGGAADRLKDASLALKRAKASGHGQSAWFPPAIGHETRERTRLLHALRRAYDHEHLFPVYQPLFCLATGRIVGFEALMRWKNEAGDYVTPDSFIPVAENSGLIVSLGAWMLHMALCAACELRKTGLADFRMAVNVSVVQFRHRDFLAMLDTALEATGARPDELELEITESVAMMGGGAMAETFAALKARGVGLAIDDFGTGFSSLAYLDQLPADRIKIDRSFVQSLDCGATGARIAEMVIPLGRSLGMQVIAEGVETARQAECLRALGCDEAQGYLFARPMALPDLLEWVRARQDAAQ